jgi:hypothetical protein
MNTQFNVRKICLAKLNESRKCVYRERSVTLVKSEQVAAKLALSI